MLDFIWRFFTASALQNVVLMTGFGLSVLLRITRKRTNILPFSLLLCFFSVATILISYPLDGWIGRSVSAMWLRPLLLISVTIVLYIVTALVLHRRFPDLYARIGRLLPVAALNNLVIGLLLVVNYRFALSLPGAVGLSLGACTGFLLLSWLVAEGVERLDNPDVPKAFRGLPSILIYLGILALALMGFSGNIPLT